jgi:hypothetical protein
MPQKLETVLQHVEEINNDINGQLIKDYHRYLISRDTGTNYQKDNIKLIHMFAKISKYSTDNLYNFNNIKKIVYKPRTTAIGFESQPRSELFF